FLYAACLFGLIQLELMLYPTLAPFLVQHQLHYSSIIYGNSALIVGLGYLSGAMCNRFLLKSFSQEQLVNTGFCLLFMSVLAQLVFSIFIGLKLWTLVFPFTLMGYAAGFIYGNLLANCLKLFPNNVGISMAMLLFLLMSLASIGLFVVSYMDIT